MHYERFISTIRLMILNSQDFSSLFASARKYVGTDYLSDRSRPDVICCALRLPFADRSFHTVVSTEILEHVPNPLQALCEMRRVLKALRAPGGKRLPVH